MSNNIQLLLNSGFDAFSNLYDVEIRVPQLIQGEIDTFIASTYMIRAQDFKPPTLALGEYKTSFKTVDLIRLNAQFVGEREFSIKVRIDANWVLYEDIKKWKNLYYQIKNDEVKLGLYSDGTSANFYGSVKVLGYKSNTESLTSTGTRDETLYWNFDNVMLYDIIEPTFNRSQSEPITVECKFIFGEYSAGTTVNPTVS